MNFWSKIRALFTARKKNTSGAMASAFDRFKSWFSPHNIFTRKNAHTLASNETIFSCVSRLSNSIGCMPIKMLDRDFRMISNHRIADMVINQPNPNSYNGYPD